MNRRNLLKFFGAAAALVAVPALARGPRFRVRYCEEGSPYTIDGMVHKYDAVARYADGHICFFGLDNDKRDDAHGRKVLEKHILASEKKHGPAVDASHRLTLWSPGVWV
jgi:hypothetical protein